MVWPSHSLPPAQTFFQISPLSTIISTGVMQHKMDTKLPALLSPPPISTATHHSGWHPLIDASAGPSKNENKAQRSSSWQISMLAAQPHELTYFLPVFKKSQGDTVQAKVFMKIYNWVFIEIKGKLWEKKKQNRTLFIMFLARNCKRGEGVAILTWRCWHWSAPGPPNVPWQTSIAATRWATLSTIKS